MAATSTLLRLVRAGTLFSPAADALAGRCLVLGADGTVWDADTLRLVLASVLVYAGGMVCNDVADVAEDRRQRPERPIPSGAISRSLAATLGLTLLLGGAAASPMPIHHGILMALVLVYDFLAKRVVLFGALCMGTLRAGNLLSGAALAGGSVSTPLLSAALCYGVYVFAVTVLGSFEEDRTVRPRAVAALQGAPMWAALGGLLAVQDGLWPAPAIALLPVLWLARRNRAISHWGQKEIRASMGYLLLGTMLYTGLLCLASGRPAECAAILACIPLARAVTARLRLRTMT